MSKRDEKAIEKLLAFPKRDNSVLKALLTMSKEVRKDNPKLSKYCLDTVRHDAAIKASNGVYVSFEIYNAALLELAQIFDDFDAYMLYVERKREPKEQFWLPRRNKLYWLSQEIQGLIDDKYDLLSVSLPPGTGKTTIGEFFISFFMGKNPNKPNLMSSHSGFMTDMFYRAVLNIIKGEEYAWSEVFPDVPFESTNANNSEINLDKWQPFKSLTCRPIRGSLTGVTRCEGVLYVDDLVSGLEEALSPGRLDKLYSEYSTDLRSRKKEGAKEIHIATRWSVHDVIGRLKRVYEGNPRANFISKPDIDPKTGESNFDYDVGGFSVQFFMDVANLMDDVSYRCLYKNAPIEREGILYHPEELRRYMGGLPEKEPDAIYGICDTKDVGTDYNALLVLYQFGERFYLEDCVFKNIDPGALDELNADMLVKHNVQEAQFESNKEGSRTAKEVERLVRLKGGRTHITTKYTTTNKETKIIVNSSWVKEHVYFKDVSEYENKSDYGVMMNQLCTYTQLGKNVHDDAPDVLAMFALYVAGSVSGRVEILNRSQLGF